MRKYYLLFLAECLDDKMRRERNTKRLQELQQQIIWPTVTDLDPRTYIPEVWPKCLSVNLYINM